jgi:hypothetical protein
MKNRFMAARSGLRRGLWGLLGVSLLAGPIPAGAGTIDWVDFSPYVVGASSQGDFVSSDGLSVAASFSNLTNFAVTHPTPQEAVVSDLFWPFDNSSVPTLVAYASAADYSTTLTFAFESAGGLPASGSVAIVDVELVNSSVSIEGVVGGLVVPVDWSFAFYTVDGDNSLPPIWDPSTNTLSGAGGTQFPTLNNFAFLTSSIDLDEVRFVIQGQRGDGIGFAVSADTVPPSVPEAGTLSLLGIGLLALGLARSRTSG